MGSERSRKGGHGSDDTDVSVGDVARTLAVLSRMLERSLGEVTPPQLRVLLLVARAPERANRLADQAAVSRPALTGVLDGLVAKGWVERAEVAGDRRGVQLELTPSGRTVLQDAQRAVADRIDTLLGQLPSDRRAVAVEGLAALGEAVTAELAERAQPR